MTRSASRSATHPATVADGLAAAFLAGPWDPTAMAKRARTALGDSPPWALDLARAVRSGFPEPPHDQRRELAEFIRHCPPFDEGNVFRTARIRVWLVAPTAMGARRWPVEPLEDRQALADWLGVDAAHLDWFADARSMERSVADERLRHYRRRWLTKDDGTARLLEAPKREMKDLQRMVLAGILDHVPTHDAAHGFRRGRSARTGALHHEGREVVLRLDLESFFTSVDAGRVYGLFRLMGYPEPVAHTLTGLCTTVTPGQVLRAAPEGPGRWWEARRRMLQRLGAPHLAQGAPTSPALANLAAFGLDRRMAGLARALGATYTRYADDLVLSGDVRVVRRARAIVRLVSTIAADEGFRVHADKTRVATAARRQCVTGLVVNQSAAAPRDEYDRLRAVLHEAVLRGPAVANRADHPAFRDHLLGRMGWVGAGRPSRAAKLASAFEAIDWS